MAIATPERKYMTMLPPRFAGVGCQLATATPQAVAMDGLAGGNPGTAGTTGGNAYVFFQADGADLYIIFAQSAGVALGINPNATGIPSAAGSPGGSISPTVGNFGGAVRLYKGVNPVRYILEPGIDLFCGFVLVDPNATGYLRWWRASMLSNG